MRFGRTTAARAGVDTGLSSARDRFERRAAAARRRPRLLVWTAFAFLVATGMIAWIGWVSSILTADRVEVIGGTAAQKAVVRQVAAVPLGGPLMRVDTDAVTRRLEADRAWSHISVSRRLPHQIVIEVTPRVPVLAVRNAKGEIDVVDQTGFAFRTVTAAPSGIPLVTSGADEVSGHGVTAALQALGALDAALRAAVTGVSVSAADQVTVLLRHKGATRTVVWGGEGAAALKAKLVKILIEQPGSAIDVSVPESPVTR